MTSPAFRRLAARVSLSIVAAILTLVAAEFATRSYLAVKKISLPQSSEEIDRIGIIRMDERLGWRSIENMAYEGPHKDAAGNEYHVRYSTDKRGFRFFGDVNSDRTKIFVVGDSFTHAGQVSNEKTYYGLIGAALPAEIFAYGIEGSGTLQQFMILEQYMDEVRPDLVLWQFCWNDFINNSLELELQSKKNNCGFRRPYPGENGEVYYALPKKHPLLRRFANHHSRLLYLILLGLDRRAAAGEDSVERDIAEEGAQHAGFRRAVSVTGKIFEMFRKRWPGVRVVGFCVGEDSPYYEEFQRLAAEFEIEFVGGISEAIRRERERNGRMTVSGDYVHWNELGHALCAEKILERLKPHGAGEED
ncbi:MAG TPA: SGNH/GDSL hydrolase family protein [Sumerlaeia bacterium]|nr:SGNH/GDSL hydrolase family protein [Sumerlaeia bacterium]